MTDPDRVHRENRPPIDLAPVLARIAERRVYARGPLMRSTREALEADTDMLEIVTLECRRLRAANVALRDVVASMRPVSK